MGTVLKALLQQRHLQTVTSFRREYDRIASKLDPDLVGHGPKKAQFYRWLSGDLASLPYPDHCRILQKMFPDWSIAELFEEFSGSIDDLSRKPQKSTSPPSGTCTHKVADIESVFPSRTEFLKALPPQELFKDARRIDMAGLSLNMLCQQFSDSDIVRLLDSGTRIRCLFLDPTGEHIRKREIEEGHPPGLLSSLTDLNIKTLERLRNLAASDSAGGMEIHVYDETIRFNITIIDSQVCVMQPYLPKARGVESPTFVARKSDLSGIFTTFTSIFEIMWTSSRERAAE